MTTKMRAARRGIGILLLAAVASMTAFGGSVDDAAKAAVPPAATGWTVADSALIDAVEAYHAALTGGDIATVASHVVTSDQFVMLEGRHSNFGWANYRDHHLAGELGDLGKVRFRLSFYRVLIDGSLGYATFAYEILPKDGPEMDFGRGFATAVLELSGDVWKMRHLHTS